MIGLLVQEKERKIDFPDSGHGGYLGFRIGTILAIFDLQVTPMFPTKFQVNSPFGSGEEAKNRFRRPCVRLSVRPYFHFRTCKYQRIFTKLGICINIAEIWFEIANG